MTDGIDRLRSALADRYTIERELGAGGMATVYLAQDLRHERKVAVKVLRPELAATLGPERFLEEVRIAANLTHPHILPLYDSGEADGFLFYVMPYIEGESLRDRLKREVELPVPEAAQIIREVVDALAHAHGQGVVHRDIKPDNVMLSGRHALVTDFGVAKAISASAGGEQMTTPGVAVGTPAYMAPEQAAASPTIDHRADIYAVGAMAYELLAGMPPFTGASAQAVLAAHMTEVPVPVTKHRETVPPDLERLVLRCLEKKPADRFQTAEAMLPYLETFGTSGGVTPTQMTPARGVRSRARWPLAIGVIGAVALGSAFAIWGGGEDSASVAGSDARVAIVPFTNRTGDPEADRWGEMAAEWSTRAVARTEVDVVPSSLVRQALRALDTSAEVSGAELVNRTDADHIVSGSYALVGDRVRFDIEITNAETGELLAALEPIDGSADSIDAVVGIVAERVAAAAVARLSSQQISVIFNPAIMSLPPNLDAYRAFSAAAQAFCEQDYEAAIRHGETALELAPDYIPVYGLVISAHSNIGRFNARRDSLIAAHRRLTPRMTDYERARYDWQSADRAIERYRAGEAVFHLSSGISWYHLALRAIEVNEISRARVAADTSSAIPMEIARCFQHWPPLWTIRTMVYYLTDDHEEALAMARDGRQRFPTHQGLIVAELRALAAMRRFAEMDSLVDVAFNLPPQNEPVGSIPIRASFELSRQGYVEEASAMARRGAAWFDEHPEADSLEAARAYYYTGQYDRAALILASLVSAENPSVTALQSYGTTLVRLGRRAEADRVDRQLASLPGTTALRARAFVAAVGRNRDAAVAHLQAYFERDGVYYSNTDAWLRDAPELAPLRGYAPFETLIAPK